MGFRKLVRLTQLGSKLEYARNEEKHEKDRKKDRGVWRI
jgi:hypothetical protein